jgi:hypothetical protein
VVSKPFSHRDQTLAYLIDLAASTLGVVLRSETYHVVITHPIRLHANVYECQIWRQRVREMVIDSVDQAILSPGRTFGKQVSDRCFNAISQCIPPSPWIAQPPQSFIPIPFLTDLRNGGTIEALVDSVCGESHCGHVILQLYDGGQEPAPDQRGVCTSVQQ